MVTTLDSMVVARSAREVLAWSRGLVEPVLRSAVDTLPSSLLQIAGYHLGWWDEDGHPVRVSGGKAIRPALTLLCAQAVGGRAAAEPAAVAVELVHNYSLLHDDVMDGDLTRRHRRTAWTVFGINPAILAGDALLVLAFDVLIGSGHPATADAVRMVTAAVQELLDGQRADLSFEQRAELELADCARMAEGKTAALIGCACALGAVFGGGTPEQVMCLRDFGTYLGLAFQHVDDLLGIWGDPAVTGKPVHSDLCSRKKSFPVVAALASQTAAGRELATLYHRDEPLSATDAAHAAELIDVAGGRDWSQKQADELLVQAIRQLHCASPAPRAAAELGALARLATHRDH
ncbi:MAG TPA: family 2 encapsulin nanocompartment cargo protein polyprenyl transferase [Pseudonocardiaceae bacterium]|jgi:geranylgeranyl diphosphate synthase type I|nr:family 2 encapsulin nanocompartment cargo protein polyprenyl transferase [Pseudonocardiaceae bacterium]